VVELEVEECIARRNEASADTEAGVVPALVRALAMVSTSHPEGLIAILPSPTQTLYDVTTHLLFLLTLLPFPHPSSLLYDLPPLNAGTVKHYDRTLKSHTPSRLHTASTSQ
jgi:hypothetical protein